jgi:hypothetical protein
LVALQLVERTTRDLDAFIAAQPGRDPGTVEPLLDALLRAVDRRGWTAEVIRRHATFCRVIIAMGGDQVEVDLAVDVPPLRDLEHVDGLPVLSALDLAARKILAILDRSEARDYSDLWALTALLGRSACIHAAQQLDGGVTAPMVATALGRLDRLDDVEFPPGAGDLASLRAGFAAWQAELR